MIELTITASNADAIIAHVTGGVTELCAVLFTTQFEREDGLIRVLAREIDFPQHSDYTRVGELEAELTPAYVARVSKRARISGLGIVFVHSHPGMFAPRFSPVDDDGEKHLSRFLSHRNAGRVHLAMVISRGGVCARRLGTKEEIQVVSLGQNREQLYPILRHSKGPNIKYDRQVRAFGPDGHALIRRTKVAIVGLGGTGSIIAQELVHLGVRDFVLIDPDVIDETNLNRVADATQKDIGTAKVDVAQHYISRVDPTASIECIKGNITYLRHASKLLNADFIFGCTDSHGSRAVLQQISYQYLIPCIDVGSTIVVEDNSVSHVIGRVQMLTPGLGCFTCANLLDANEVRRDMMSDSERRLDPYLQGVTEPAPAVISLNGIVSSLGVTMFLSHIANFPAPGRHLIYDALASKLRSVRVDPAPDCYYCSLKGGFARAVSVPLQVRED